ncbi:MAG TPA: hypothetical protein VHX65_04265 [Pirellulales bacterium]|nr:hypothetical protein [Pirellulales bacterium]
MSRQPKKFSSRRPAPMLVIVSDLRLGDGSLAATLPRAAMELLAAKLRALAFAASFRPGGDYRPVETIDLVLLGDILDLIGSAHWLAGDIRPWHDRSSAAAFDTLCRIAADALEHNRAALEILRRLAHRRAISVPRQRPATHTASTAAVRQTVPVRIHYMVGDRDWPLHLPGANCARLRAVVGERMGIVQRATAVFPHDPGESEFLSQALARHRVLARHGDIYDPLHFEVDRNTSSLGDALAIEFLGRFQLALRGRRGELSPLVLAGLEQVASVRPMFLASAWIDAVLEQTCESADLRSHVRLLWNQLLDEFLELPAIRSRQTWNPIDLVDALSTALRFSPRRQSDSRRSIGSRDIDCFRGGGNSAQEYLGHARAEDAVRHDRVRHVVYGHAAETSCAPLDADFPAERAVAHGFNVGSWQRAISPDAASVTNDTLSLVAFYREGECGGLPFETWSGSWRRPSERVLRFDPPHAAVDQSCRRICSTTLSDSVPGSG